MNRTNKLPKTKDLTHPVSSSHLKKKSPQSTPTKSASRLSSLTRVSVPRSKVVRVPL